MAGKKEARRIGVLGGGNVGGTLARLWAGKGHTVSIGVPDPNRTQAKAGTPGINVRLTTNREAAAGAEIVALAVPWLAAQEAIRAAGDLKGKVVIDCTNPLSPDMKSLAVGTTISAAEQVAQWATGARVVKAFNTIGAIGAVNFGNAQFGNLHADGFYCGDDGAAKAVVRDLIEDAGLDPVDVGPLSNARMLEPLALLWIDLAFTQGQGLGHAFKLLRR